MKRIVCLNRYFFPDHSATSQMLGDLAFHLARSGYGVHVFASRQRYDDPQAKLPEIETVRGVSICRLSSTQFGRSALLGRGFDYLTFYRSVWRAVLAKTQPGDILVAKTDPPLLCIPAMQAAKRRGLRLVNWLQDLYPEVAARLDVPLIKGPLAGGLLRLRDAALRAAEVNIVVGERMAEIVRARGIAPERVQVIPNWCDNEEIRSVLPLDNPLRRSWGLDDRFVVGYSGNLGRGHEFATILGAAERLRNEPRIVFLFIGGGNQLDELARRVHERKLDQQFRFLPYQDRAALSYSLSVPDVHWLSLKPELEGLIVPSKFLASPPQLGRSSQSPRAMARSRASSSSMIAASSSSRATEPGWPASCVASPAIVIRLSRWASAPARCSMRISLADTPSAAGSVCSKQPLE